MPMISASSSDLQLLQVLRDHQDRIAFEIIINRYEEKVFSLCFRMINSREEAEDIAQEIFLKLWENPADWEPVAKFSTWLYKVTTNRCLNQLRFLKLKSFLSINSKKEEYLASDESSPEADLLYSEKSIRFQQAFSKLPGRQKAALHLRYWEGLSVKDVANALSVTLKSAESLIYRGKRTLSRMII